MLRYFLISYVFLLLFSSCSITDDKYVLGEVAIAANSVEDVGLLKVYILDEDDDHHSVLRGVNYRFDDYDRPLNRFEKVAFKIGNTLSGIPLAEDIITEFEGIPFAERYYESYLLPEEIAFSHNLHVEGPEKLWHNKIHIQNGNFFPGVNADAVVQLNAVLVESGRPVKIPIQKGDIPVVFNSQTTYSPMLAGYDTGGPYFELSTNHDHLFGHQTDFDNFLSNPINWDGILDLPEISIEPQFEAREGTLSSADFLHCFDWSDNTQGSLLFYMEDMSNRTFSIDTFYSVDDKICINRDLEKLHYFFIIPYKGMALSKEDFTSNVVLQPSSERLINVKYDNSLNSLMGDDIENELNDMLDGIFSGFNVNFQERFDERLTAIAENDNVNSFSLIRNELQTLLTESSNHLLVPDDELMNKYYPSAEGAYDRLEGNKHLYFGRDSLLHSKYLTLHELCHISLVDEEIEKFIIDVDDEVVMIQNLMASVNDSYCYSGITYEDLFLLQGMNPKFAPRNKVLYFKDTEGDCPSDFFEESILAYLPCKNSDCWVDDDLLTDKLRDAITANVKLFFERSLLLGEAASNSNMQRFYDELVLKVKYNVYTIMKEKIGKKYTFKEVMKSEKLRRSWVQLYNDSLGITKLEKPNKERKYIKLNGKYLDLKADADSIKNLVPQGDIYFKGKDKEDIMISKEVLQRLKTRINK